MTDMQVILAGMDELKERVQMPKPELESWSEQQWRKVQKCHYNRSKGSARLRRSTSLCRLKARTTGGENGPEFFAVGLGDFLVVRWQKSTNTSKDRNDSATIIDLAPTTLRFHSGLVCNIPTELYRMLIC